MEDEKSSPVNFIFRFFSVLFADAFPFLPLLARPPARPAPPVSLGDQEPRRAGRVARAHQGEGERELRTRMGRFATASLDRWSGDGSLNPLSPPKNEKNNPDPSLPRRRPRTANQPARGPRVAGLPAEIPRRRRLPPRSRSSRKKIR